MNNGTAAGKNIRICACPCGLFLLFSGAHWLRYMRTHLLSSILDGTHDILIPCAAADIAFQFCADLCFRRIGVVFEQLIRCHDHAWSAEATLEAMLFPESFLVTDATSISASHVHAHVSVRSVDAMISVSSECVLSNHSPAPAVSGVCNFTWRQSKNCLLSFSAVSWRRRAPTLASVPLTFTWEVQSMRVCYGSTAERFILPERSTVL